MTTVRSENTKSCHLAHTRSDEGILFYSIRSGAGPASPLQGSRLEDDGIPIQPLNDHLMGQIDSIEAGEMTGWACMKGYMGKPLQVCSKIDSCDLPCCSICKRMMHGALQSSQASALLTIIEPFATVVYSALVLKPTIVCIGLHNCCGVGPLTIKIS